MANQDGANQVALQALVDRNELADEAERVGLCDGLDATAVKKYLEELEYVPNPLKIRVMRRTARGAFRRELEDFIADQDPDHKRDRQREFSETAKRVRLDWIN